MIYRAKSTAQSVPFQTFNRSTRYTVLANRVAALDIDGMQEFMHVRGGVTVNHPLCSEGDHAAILTHNSSIQGDDIGDLHEAAIRPQMPVAVGYNGAIRQDQPFGCDAR